MIRSCFLKTPPFPCPWAAVAGLEQKCSSSQILSGLCGSGMISPLLTLLGSIKISRQKETVFKHNLSAEDSMFCVCAVIFYLLQYT